MRCVLRIDGSAMSSAPRGASRSAAALYRYCFFASFRWCRQSDDTIRSAPNIGPTSRARRGRRPATRRAIAEARAAGRRGRPHRRRSVERRQRRADEAREQRLARSRAMTRRHDHDSSAAANGAAARAAISRHDAAPRPRDRAIVAESSSVHASARGSRTKRRPTTDQPPSSTTLIASG